MNAIIMGREMVCSVLGLFRHAFGEERKCPCRRHAHAALEGHVWYTLGRENALLMFPQFGYMYHTEVSEMPMLRFWRHHRWHTRYTYMKDVAMLNVNIPMALNCCLLKVFAHHCLPALGSFPSSRPLPHERIGFFRHPGNATKVWW